MMNAKEIHAHIGSRWPDILRQLGVPEENLRKKNGPCPGCGGRDRFFFSNKFGRGDFFCRHCSPTVAGKQRGGDGFTLLQMVNGWDFKTARSRVLEAAGLSKPHYASMAPARSRTPTHPAVSPEVAHPTARVHRLRRDRCAIENCDDAVDYLASRHLWPLPAGCSLRAHATVEYWDGNARVGRYPAIVADVLDVAGELVTCHITYLEGGKKLAGHEPRKILSAMTGRDGCAVRLMPAADVLGIAEGIETALSAALLDDVPVWAALNTSLLARFEPPPGVTTLRVYGDRDEAGLSAALKLLERLQGRIRVEIRTPPAPAKDWNDVLMKRNGRASGEGSP